MFEVQRYGYLWGSFIKNFVVSYGDEATAQLEL